MELRTRSPFERAIDASLSYVRTLLDTLSLRFWIAFGVASTVVAIGDVIGLPILRYLGFGVAAVLVLMWLAVGTSEHIRHVRERRGIWRDLGR